MVISTGWTAEPAPGQSPSPRPSPTPTQATVEAVSGRVENLTLEPQASIRAALRQGKAVWLAKVRGTFISKARDLVNQKGDEISVSDDSRFSFEVPVTDPAKTEFMLIAVNARGDTEKQTFGIEVIRPEVEEPERPPSERRFRTTLSFLPTLLKYRDEAGFQFSSIAFAGGLRGETWLFHRSFTILADAAVSAFGLASVPPPPRLLTLRLHAGYTLPFSTERWKFNVSEAAIYSSLKTSDSSFVWEARGYSVSPSVQFALNDRHRFSLSLVYIPFSGWFTISDSAIINNIEWLYMLKNGRDLSFRLGLNINNVPDANMVAASAYSFGMGYRF